MKARDKVRLETLRNIIKKVFLEAKTALGANDTLRDADAAKILAKLCQAGQRVGCHSCSAEPRTLQTPSWHTGQRH